MNLDTCKLFNFTKNKNFKIDDIVTPADMYLATSNFQIVLDTILSIKERDSILEKFFGLNKQCKIISFVADKTFSG